MVHPCHVILPAIFHLHTSFRSPLKLKYGTDGLTNYVTRQSTAINA